LEVGRRYLPASNLLAASIGLATFSKNARIQVFLQEEFLGSAGKWQIDGARWNFKRLKEGGDCEEKWIYTY
jgi:hypothetical protein